MKKVPAPAADDLISRRGIMGRWGCSDETIKRREKAGDLTPIRFSKRMIRYKLSQVMALESQGDTPKPRRKPPTDPLIGRAALAERLECNVRTLRRYEAEGKLTPIQMDPEDPASIGYRMAQVHAIEEGN
jgi:hypothetical protein